MTMMIILEREFLRQVDSFHNKQSMEASGQHHEVEETEWHSSEKVAEMLSFVQNYELATIHDLIQKKCEQFAEPKHPELLNYAFVEIISILSLIYNKSNQADSVELHFSCYTYTHNLK